MDQAPMKKIKDLFPEISAFGTRRYPNISVPAPGMEGQDVPDLDLDYEFQPQALYSLLMALRCNDKTLIIGHSGCGKTSLVNQVCSRLGFEVYRINFDLDLERPQLVGEKIIDPETGGTPFEYGIVPRALCRPAVLLLDEWDRIKPGVAFVFQRIMEEDGKLMILEKGGETITPHPLSRIVATANTAGMGDEDGVYAASLHQDFAQIDRFGMFIRMDYLPKAQEEELVKKKYRKSLETGKIDEAKVQSFVQVANSLRAGFVNRSISTPFSTRTLLVWVRHSLVLNDEARAAEMAFLNAMSDTDRQSSMEIIKRMF